MHSIIEQCCQTPPDSMYDIAGSGFCGMFVLSGSSRQNDAVAMDVASIVAKQDTLVSAALLLAE